MFSSGDAADEDDDEEDELTPAAVKYLVCFLSTVSAAESRLRTRSQ